MASLTFYRNGEPLLDYRLRSGRTSVGRADSCDIALPGEAISRHHCDIIGRADRWELVDRSRHGTFLDGRRVERADLEDGDVVVFSDYQVHFRDRGREVAPTAEPEPDRAHELLLEAAAGVMVQQAVLLVTEGPEEGRRLPLDAARVSVGGPGSVLELDDPSLVARHCWLRVARGRVMVEPGAGASRLDGQRVRSITPVYAGEEVAIGSTAFQVELGQAEVTPLAAHFGDLRGDSVSMRRLFGVLRRISGHHYPVLVIGESGTGKELIARGIHEHSSRAERPFVAVNCGAIPPRLFESELFGHEKGAFTGAEKAKEGLFVEADGGTIFLDEIGELPEEAQAKLLRVLETGEVRPVGGSSLRHPDVRVVAATNRDLAEAVKAGRFREDLFFRLAVLTVSVPPLRERVDDLPVLCRTLCAALHPEATVTDRAMELLKRHTWPGNVRELRNVLTRAYVLGGPQIDVTDLSFHQITEAAAPAPSTARGNLDDTEASYLRTVLERHGDNRSAAARELGIARSTLHYKMRKYGLA